MCYEQWSSNFHQKERSLHPSVKKSYFTLRGYPRVKALLEQTVTLHHVYQRRRNQPEEEDLVQLVKGAIIVLTDLGEHLTLRKVERMVKFPRKC